MPKQPTKYNSIHAGNLVDSEQFIVTVSNGTSTIGIVLRDVNQGVDYTICRLLGAKWYEDEDRKITIDSLISYDTLEVTGKEFDQWFNKKEDQENQKIRSFWNAVQEKFKRQGKKPIHKNEANNHGTNKLHRRREYENQSLPLL